MMGFFLSIAACRCAAAVVRASKKTADEEESKRDLGFCFRAFFW
jgi:hypothetical protein